MINIGDNAETTGFISEFDGGFDFGKHGTSLKTAVFDIFGDFFGEPCRTNSIGETLWRYWMCLRRCRGAGSGPNNCDERLLPGAAKNKYRLFLG